MRILGAIGLSGVILLSATVAGAAQSVPLPVPSPKKGNVAPSEAAQPAAVAPPPATTGAATAVPGRQNGSLDSKQLGLAERVSAYLSNVQTLSGNFIQIGPDGGRTEGNFYIQKPGKVRFAYNPPSPIDVISDGSSVVVRDRKLATQDLYPLSQTPLRYLLADKIDLARDTNLISVSVDDVFVTLVIEERQALTGTHRLMMMFGAKDFQLRQWTVTDPQGYDTTVAVYNLDEKSKLDPGLFKINYERMLQ
ncbi:MAG: outer membrane lipoprotein carrier protein LolA [Xanthobacteraceae bacterium]